MTAEEFRSNYTLGKCLVDEGIKTFAAEDVFGTAVLVHLLPGPADPEAALGRHVLDLMEKLASSDSRRIREELEVEGRPVVVTDPDDRLFPFPRWLEGSVSGQEERPAPEPEEAAPAAPDPTEAGRQVPDMGEFTRLFAVPDLGTTGETPSTVGMTPPPEEEPQTALPGAPPLERDSMPEPSPSRAEPSEASGPEADPGDKTAGEFTRLFGALDRGLSPEEAPASSAEPPAKASPAELPGVEARPAESVPDEPSVGPPFPGPSQETPQGPGEFTRLFGTGTPADTPADAPADAPAGDENASEEEFPAISREAGGGAGIGPVEQGGRAGPAQPVIRPREEFPGPEPIPEPGEPPSGESGRPTEEVPPTQPGIRWQDAGAPPMAEPAPPEPSKSPSIPDEASRPPGEFTRMFGAPQEPPPVPGPEGPEEADTLGLWGARPGGGGEDQGVQSDTESYLGRLYGPGPEGGPSSASPSPHRQPALSDQPTPRMSGPSDYTRIISGSTPSPPPASPQPMPRPAPAKPSRARFIVLVVVLVFALLGTVALVVYFARGNDDESSSSPDEPVTGMLDAPVVSPPLWG